jgi:hypothetical protein
LNFKVFVLRNLKTSSTIVSFNNLVTIYESSINHKTNILWKDVYIKSLKIIDFLKLPMPLIFCIVILALSSWPKLKHESVIICSKNVFRFKHTPTSVRMWVSTLLSGFLLCDLKIYNVLNIWNKSVDSKFGPNWTPNIPLENSWSIDIESELKFSFKVYDLKVMNKIMFKSQIIGNLTLNH